MAQRWLRQSQQAGNGRETSMFGESDDESQVPDLDCGFPG
jgi:hypothetical protein